MRFRNPFGKGESGGPNRQQRAAETNAAEASLPVPPAGGYDPYYFRGRTEWNERYGSYIARAKNWRYAALGSIAVNALLALGMVHIASESRVEPYIVEVNHLGEAAAMGPADAAPMPNAEVIKATLAAFIGRIRMAWPNPVLAQRFAEETYNYVAAGSQAQQFLNIYLRKKFSQSDDGLVVTPQINAVSNIGKNTWQIDWSETITGTSNNSTETKHYQAILHIVLVPPTSAQEILKNPLGIYIKTLSWTQVL